MTMTNNCIKLISLVLIISLLACSAPGRQQNMERQLSIKPDEAIMMLTGTRKVRLLNKYGIVFDGHILSWNEIGFIVEKNGLIDTVEYAILNNKLAIETDGTLIKKGTQVGCGLGAIITSILAISSYSSPPEKTDMGDWRPILLALSGLVLIGGGTVIGAIIGANKTKYTKYYYSHNQFKNNPYISQAEGSYE